MDLPMCNTPKKARIRGAYEYCETKGIPCDQKELFEFFDVTEQQGLEILRSDSDRTGSDNEDTEKALCGGKRKPSDIFIKPIEELLDKQEAAVTRLCTEVARAAKELEDDGSKRTARSASRRQRPKKRAAGGR